MRLLIRLRRVALMAAPCVLLAIRAHHALAQDSRPGAIDGLVTDSTLAPIDGADITIFRTSVRIQTGTSGRFKIQQVPAGQYLVIVRRLGYRPASGIVEVLAGETVRLTYTLERVVANLDTTVITAQRVSMKMVEFEARRRVGTGQYLTQEQIERHGSVYATELFRTMNGIQVVPAPGGGGAMSYVVISSRSGPTNFETSSAGTRSGPCYTQVFIDGVRLPPGSNLDLLPSPKEIAGIEVYPTAAFVPAEYAVWGAGCGVILVWTKDEG